MRGSGKKQELLSRRDCGLIGEIFVEQMDGDGICSKEDEQSVHSFFSATRRGVWRGGTRSLTCHRCLQRGFWNKYVVNVDWNQRNSRGFVQCWISNVCDGVTVHLWSIQSVCDWAISAKGVPVASTARDVSQTAFAHCWAKEVATTGRRRGLAVWCLRTPSVDVDT